MLCGGLEMDFKIKINGSHTPLLWLSLQGKTENKAEANKESSKRILVSVQKHS